MNRKQTRIFEAFNALGWIAWLYPRKKLIAINGFPAVSIKDAVAQMEAALDNYAAQFTKGSL